MVSMARSGDEVMTFAWSQERLESSARGRLSAVVVVEDGQAEFFSLP